MDDQIEKKGFSGLQVLGIAIIIMVLTFAGTIFAAKAWFFPPPFKPVVLSKNETSILENKLLQFENQNPQNCNSMVTTAHSQGNLKPEPYSETNPTRAIVLSEREINALLAKNTDLANKLAIDLSNELISAKLLLPVDPDFPVLGGKTIRVKAGVQIAYLESQPVIKIKGISVMGIPVPAAWMGGLKNMDLIDEFGNDAGFWQAFAAGIDSVTVTEGQLHIQLKQ